MEKQVETLFLEKSNPVGAGASKDSAKGEKSAPSFFDSLLSTAKEQKATNEEIKTEVKNVVDSTKENKEPTKVSLLDKLIIEAKKELSTNEQSVKVEDGKKEIVNTSLDDKEGLTIKTEEPNKEAKTLSSQNLKEEITQLTTNINLPKEQTANSKENQGKDKATLFDQLIQKSKNLVFGKEQLSSEQKDIQSKEFLTNIYLGSQKNSVVNQQMFNKNEAMNIASNATTIQDVEKSASMLDLGLEDIDVQKAVQNIKKLDLDKIDRSNLLDKLAFNKNIMHVDLKQMITQSVEASKALIEDTLTVVDDISMNINSQTAHSIQTRIIGAKQQMNQMMSDVARQMYENYKPPVTAFRLNLNPATLGAISIVMKNDRENSLSISMSVSSNSTLDALVDNQNSLRNSLNKMFNDSTTFNLDFSSSSENNQSSNQNEQNSQERQNQASTQNSQIDENLGEKDKKDTAYM